ncbi:hypothetical protein AMTRI_Chr05g71350 [Amborella trichopoda]
MKKIPDEHEYTQNPMAREFHKKNAKDCLSPRSMIQDRRKEPLPHKKFQLNRAGVDDPNLEVIDSQIQIEESNCSQNFETQENKECTRKISILVEETSAQKVQDIPVIHVTTKENDSIFQISIVDDPQEAQVINELNRDPEARDSQDYICEQFLNSTFHEETKESSLEDSVELSINVNPKEDPTPPEWMKEIEHLEILKGPSRPPSPDFLADSPIWDEELNLKQSITLVTMIDSAINSEEADDPNLIILEDPTPLQELKEIKPLKILRGPLGPFSQDFLNNPPIWDEEPDIKDQIILFPEEKGSKENDRSRGMPPLLGAPHIQRKKEDPTWVVLSTSLIAIAPYNENTIEVIPSKILIASSNGEDPTGAALPNHLIGAP